MFVTKGQWHHFVHMHAAWGSINLLISTWCLYQARQLSPMLSKRATAQKEREFRLFLGVNLGLDLLYLAAAGWLWQLAMDSVMNSALLLGFGEAVGLQGLVLLSFDTSSMLISLRRYRMSNAKALAVSPKIMPAAAIGTPR